MTKMRAMVVPKAGAKLVAEERDLTTPATHEVRIRPEWSLWEKAIWASAIRACPVMR